MIQQPQQESIVAVIKSPVPPVVVLKEFSQKEKIGIHKQASNFVQQELRYK